MSKIFFLIIIILCQVLFGYAQHTPRPNIIGPNNIEVNIRTGNLFHQRTDFSIPGRGISTDITFSFNTSLDTLDFGYGKGWTFTYNMRYDTLASSIIILRPDGRQDDFVLNGGGYQSPTGVFDVLEEYETDKFRLTTKHGMKYFLDDVSHKKLTKIEDTNGNALVLTYSGSDLATLTNASGRTLNFTFTNERLTQITDLSTTPNRIITYSYDGTGRLLCVTDPNDNQQCYEYGDFNNITSVSDPRGVPVYLEYDSGLRVVRMVSCLGEQSITYAENKTYLVERSGGATRVTHYNMDEQGRLTALRDPSGNLATFTYDSNNNLTSFTDFNGYSQIYTYDSEGNVLTESDPFGNVTIYTYDPVYNKIAGVTDRRGNATTFTYDGNGNLFSVNAPLGVNENFEYNGNGDLDFVVDGSGDTTQYSYDGLGNLSDIQFPIGNQVFEYDGAGNLTKITDANNNKLHFSYDALNRLLYIADPQSDTTHFSYNETGNLVADTDANGVPKSYVYDALGRLISVTIPAGTTNYEYDFFGNLTKVTDANGHATTYTYNAQNLVSSVTDAAGNETNYLYDSNGNLLQKTHPNGKAITYSYDALNRLTSQSYDENTDHFTYDEEGNMISASNNEITINFSYDELGRLSSKTIADWGKTVSYTYNAAGDRLTMTDPDSGVTNYTYDDNHRLISLTNPQNETTTFTYDTGGRITQQYNANGTYATYTYDAVGNLLILCNLKSTGDTISFFAYTYDNIGNRLTMTDLTGTHQYFYDDNYQVDSVVYSTGDWEAFAYDSAGNRTAHTKNGVVSSYFYNDADMIITGEGASFNFDENGNMVSKTNTSGMTTYEYDSHNRLSKVTLPDGKTNLFQYDPFGTRISLTDTLGMDTRFVHDLDNLLMELNDEGGVEVRYTAGLGVDSWLGMERGGGSYFYHKDGLNSITDLTDNLKSEKNYFAYDVFGNINQTLNDVENNLSYTGRYLDGEAGLYFYRARYYISQIGRFSTEDLFPGFKTNPFSQNNYVYAESNSINKLDPYGDIAQAAIPFIIGYTIGGTSSIIFDLLGGERDVWAITRQASIAALTGGVAAYAPATYGWGVTSTVTSGALTAGVGNGYTQIANDFADGRFVPDVDGGEVVTTMFTDVITGGIGRKIGRKVSNARYSQFLDDGLPLNPVKFYDAIDYGKTYGLIWERIIGSVLTYYGNQYDFFQNLTDNIFSFFEFFIITTNAIDPNDITGPAGFDHPGPDTLRWVSINDQLGYLIRFENDPDFATAPAQRVHITVSVDPHLDILSFRLADFGFGDFQFQVPPNTSFYTERLDVVDSLGVFVDITAGIDLTKNEMFWILQSIDPATGLPPEDPLAGFLPVNDTLQIDSLTQQGEGFVNFSIVPDDAALTLDTSFAQASIVFDDNEPVLTNTWHNVIDAFAPQSVMDSLPIIIDSTTFTLNWSAEDDPDGVGVASYDLYISVDENEYYLLQESIDTTAYEFTGVEGSTYAFYTRAKDHVGNIEAQKFIEDTKTTIGGDIIVKTKVILQGPYDETETLMQDQLRLQDLIPLSTPYIGEQYPYGSIQEVVIDNSVFDDLGNNSIIDWIYVEIFDMNLDSSIAGKSCLLQRDGDIVGLDGEQPPIFENLDAGFYQLIIYHRNHLPIKTKDNIVELSSEPTFVNLTNDISILIGGINAIKEIGGIYTMIAGDVDQNGQIQNTDKNLILPQLGTSGYLIWDIDMDGQVQQIDIDNFLIPNLGRGKQFDNE